MLAPRKMLLPEMAPPCHAQGGMEVVAEVRKRWPGTRVRIVAVTADAFEDTREQCLAGGFDGWCEASPFSPLQTYPTHLSFLCWPGEPACRPHLLQRYNNWACAAHVRSCCVQHAISACSIWRRLQR